MVYPWTDPSGATEIQPEITMLASGAFSAWVSARTVGANRVNSKPAIQRFIFHSPVSSTILVRANGRAHVLWK